VSHPTPPETDRTRAVLELVGLILLVAGLAGLEIVLFSLHAIAGWGGLSAIAITAGARLTLSEV
jgi:hypothetical protein